jgi:hydroxyquinol 1,2-dioxygenase
VVAMNNQRPEGCTEATVFGPFYVEGAPEIEQGGDVANGAAGEPCVVKARVRGIDGEAIPGAVVNVWQADAAGHYDVQYEGLQQAQGRGVLRTGPDGELDFRTTLASSYPIPHDGPVGDLLKAAGRHPWRPAHLHFMIEAPGYERLITHVFRDDDEWLDSDAVFGVRQSLIAPWTRDDKGVWHLDFEFVLNPTREAVQKI